MNILTITLSIWIAIVAITVVVDVYDIGQKLNNLNGKRYVGTHRRV